MFTKYKIPCAWFSAFLYSKKGVCELRCVSGLQDREYLNLSLDLCGPPELRATVGKQDVLQSPNFPRSYPSNTECWWFISAPPGYVIQIEFNQFTVEICCDRVQVFRSYVFFLHVT